MPRFTKRDLERQIQAILDKHKAKQEEDMGRKTREDILGKALKDISRIRGG